MPVRSRFPCLISLRRIWWPLCVGPHGGRVGTYVEGSAGSLPFTARYDWIRFDELVAPATEPAP